MVTADTIQIDPGKMRYFLETKRMTSKQLSEELGFTGDYISTVMDLTYMSVPIWKCLKALYNLDDDTFTPDPVIPNSGDNDNWGLTLKVMSDRVRIGLTDNGREIDYAFSKIRGEREVDLFQAISYAAHILYKNAEQRDLRGG